MAKIAPMRAKTKEESVKVYSNVYDDVERFISMKLKWRGIHSLIVDLLRRELRGARVLDVGCGFGRFSFLSARLAKRVTGLDMTQRALDVANSLKKALSAENVEFVLSDVESFDPDRRFDVIYLGGVLEHLIDPAPVLARIADMLPRGGRLVINCPGESNFRGDVSTTLWKLFDFPMSLSDVRLVNRHYMRTLCAKEGYLFAKMVGCMYSRAWGEMGAKDLETRIPSVLEDVRDRVTGMRVQVEAFNEWVRGRAAENQAFLDYLVRRRILRRIPRRAPFRIDERVLEDHGLPVDAIRAYLAPDFAHDPYYCDVLPFSLMGGQVIYVLRRSR